MKTFTAPGAKKTKFSGSPADRFEARMAHRRCVRHSRKSDNRRAIEQSLGLVEF